jgi:hypothetical protein
VLKRFRQGKLKNDNDKQTKNSPHDDVKDKLIENIELKEQLYKHNKCRLSWAVLKKSICL